jgi:hypothetical protein
LFFICSHYAATAESASARRQNPADTAAAAVFSHSGRGSGRTTRAARIPPRRDLPLDLKRLRRLGK